MLAAFLRGLPGGPGALVLSGPAGAGKTTLLRAAVAEATALGMTVLATQPAGSDVRLAFTGLSDLLGPELDALLPRLPPPQRRALSVALQIQDAPGRPPEPHTIAVAVRTGAGRAGRRGPGPGRGGRRAVARPAQPVRGQLRFTAVGRRAGRAARRAARGQR